MLLLPDGVSYLPGTLEIDGLQIADPRIVAQSVNIGLAEQFGEWASEIRFTAAIDADVVGELTTKAFAKFDSPIEAGQQTPIVETSMSRDAAVVENEGYVLNLKFGVLSAELSTNDALQLGNLIENWEGATSSVRDLAQFKAAFRSWPLPKTRLSGFPFRKGKSSS